MSNTEKKLLIFIVEDDPASQQLKNFILKDQFEICFAVSVAEAKKVLVERDIDLILLDLSLIGDEDGLDLAKYLRATEKWKDIPIIAVTAHAYISDKRKCLEAGCNDYLAKPIKREDLLERIKKYI